MPSDRSTESDSDAQLRTTPSDGGRAVGRRRILQSTAAATALGLVGSATATSDDEDGDGDGDGDEDGDDYAPIPDTAKGPEIPEKGYLVEEIRDDLYWITQGSAQMMFLVSDAGVIVVDALPMLGTKILDAIREVTDEPITHVVYSHYHADHIGAASVYPDDAEYIAHVETARYLDRFGEDTIPSPTTVFGPREIVLDREGSRGRGRGGQGWTDGRNRPRRHVPVNSFTLTVGDQRLELDYRGANHSLDNLYVYAPAQRVLMNVDVIFPGWVPFENLARSSDIPGWIDAHDEILTYDFDTLVAGHVTRLGTPEDVRIQREYVTDLRDNVEDAIATVSPRSAFRGVDPENQWALFEAYNEAVIERATEPTLEKWLGELGGADVFTAANASVMLESLQLDYGNLGPFDFRPE